jgi:hypothetical protein
MLKGIENIDLTADDAVDQINALAAGLVSKKDELKDLLAKANTEARKERIGEASAAELERLRQFEKTALRSQEEEKGNYQKALDMAQSDFTKQLESLQSQLQEKESALTKLLIDDGLNKALDGVNVNPSLKAGAEAILRSQAQLTDGKAMIGDKSLSDAVQEWAESDAGKAFCLAPNNSGGNANGGGTSYSSNKKFSDYSSAELSQIRQTKPEEYQRLLTTR